MHTLIRSWIFALAALVASVAFGADSAPAGSAAIGDGEMAATIPVPDGIAVADVQRAILTAASGRGWAIKEKGDERIVLFLEQNGWRSQLTVSYTAKEVKIFSNSDKLDRSGKPKKHAIPTGWVNFLKGDITKGLNEKAYLK